MGNDHFRLQENNNNRDGNVKLFFLLATNTTTESNNKILPMSECKQMDGREGESEKKGRVREKVSYNGK